LLCRRNIACNLAKRTVAPEIEWLYEAGSGAEPAALSTVTRRCHRLLQVTNMYELFAFFLERGHVTWVLAAQIDRLNLNTTAIGDYAQPKVQAGLVGARSRSTPRRFHHHAAADRSRSSTRSTS
jgi:hypothetical protein